MDFYFALVKLLLVGFFIGSQILVAQAQIFLPIRTKDRTSVRELALTEIGKFGIPRKPRRNIPGHLHSGIDIRRPSANYVNEPIYPIAKGVVISKRDDGPYAQLIIEHSVDNRKIWSCYEHIADIVPKVGDRVDSHVPMARFMNTDELGRYGRQFDHFHFEILKNKPMALKPERKNPERFFNSFSLMCYSEKDLEKYFYAPEIFFKAHLK